ncbi:MAG: hypothetical protein ACRYFU_19620 [Janthinobacterium lividum]
MTGPDWIENTEEAGEDSPGLGAGTTKSSLEIPAELEGLECTLAELAALESELGKAMRPVALPAGFTDRVVTEAFAASAATKIKRAKVLPFRSWRLVAGGAIAACLVAGFFGAEDVHERREREHAAVIANQQFKTATRITDEALEHTREQLRRAGVESLQ